MTTMKRIVIAGLLLAGLSGCGIFGGGGDKKSKTPVLGERIPVLAFESGAEVDPATADVAVELPAAEVNVAWAQPGGNAAKAMGHLALGQNLAPVWRASIDGSSKKARLGAAPIVADGKLFAVDVRGVVRAFDAGSGARLWSAEIGNAKVSPKGAGAAAAFGGGVSFEAGKLYAVNGLGDVASIDATSGAVGWAVRPGGPLRGAPTVANGQVYVISQDNQVFALKADDGAVVWTSAGTLETAGVFGVAAPAAGQGTVVTGFSSGELNAYRYENGRVVWQDALSRTSISTAVASLSDIDASPVIDQGRVYAIGQGGRMVAMELNTGQRLWELNIAGIATPWVAGDWIYVVTDDARLLCIQRTSGKIRWITQLPRWRDEEDKKGPVSWTGPVLAGNRLILASSNGWLVNVDAGGGKILSNGKAGGNVYLPPVVANQTLFTLDNSGTITAWR